MIEFHLRFTYNDYRLQLPCVGQINALCGANSSGKSTTLRSLESSVEMGRRLRDLIPESAVEDLLTKIITPIDHMDIGHARRARELVNRQLQLDSDLVIFENDVERYSTDLKRLWHRSDGHTYIHYHLGHLTDLLKRNVSSIATRRLIPAKREFRPETPLSTDRQPLGTGSEVATGLFLAQNSRTNKDEIEKLNRIETAFREVTGGVEFAVELKGSAVLVYFRFPGGDLIPADECGLGLQDVLVILYNAIFDGSQMLLIEEPENHLHPSWQRSLLSFLRSTQKIIFFATHSSTLLDDKLTDRVYVCRFQSGCLSVSTADAKIAALRELGYVRSDFVTARVLAIVEGPDDQDVVRHYLTQEFKVADGLVAFQFTGGDTGNRFQIEHLKEAFGDVIVFLDSEIDKGSRRNRKTLKTKCEPYQIDFRLSDLPNLEFYFSMQAYGEVFPSVVFPEAWDCTKHISQQTSAPVKRHILDLARKTPWEHIEDTDLGAFIKALAMTVSIPPPRQV